MIVSIDAPITAVDHASLTREQWIELIDSRLAQQLQTASYQPESRSGRDGATAQGEAVFWDSFTIELVEATASVNLSDLITGESANDSGCERLLNVEAKAGRFVVPFGGFAAMNHPGVYRTISTPLMFNMGRRVGPLGPLQPVLPGPYADEGVNLHSRLALVGDTAMTVDVFAVNGLQQGGPGIFNASRRYYDNNREPAVGGRVTVGNSSYRLGPSLMTGTLHDDGAPQLDYQLASADATWRYISCQRNCCFRNKSLATNGSGL